MDAAPPLPSPNYRREFSRLVAPLTRNERRVLKRFIDVPNDKMVAQSLGKRPQTIRNQIAVIMRKLEVDSREELILLVLHIRFRGRRPKARDQGTASRGQGTGDKEREAALKP